MRFRVSVCLLIAAASCRTGVVFPPADAIVEGRTVGVVPVDTIDDVQTIGIAQAAYSARRTRPDTRDFWRDVGVLDMVSADAAARSLDELTFSLALKQLLGGDAENAAVAFGVLRGVATDAVVRARARVGLTMALSWQSDWVALSRVAGDSADGRASGDMPAAVERWGRALANVPPMQVAVPLGAVTLPMPGTPTSKPPQF